MKDVGFNTQNKGDRGKKEKFEDEMTYWYKNPVWIQTGFVGLIFLGFVAMNWPSLSYNITNAFNGIAGMRLQDIFAISFIMNLIVVAYFILVQIWTGGITNKLIYAKLFKKRTMWFLGEDNVKKLYLPKTDKVGWWRVKNVGEWKTVKRAMYWLENGTLGMDVVEEHAEGICLNDIVDKCIIKTDPQMFEKRNDTSVLEGYEMGESPWKKVDIMTLMPLMMLIAIVGYIVILAMQGNECQSQLVSLARTCGEATAGIVNNTTTTTLKPGQEIVSMIK
jgi:hypothetical protein